MEKSRMEAYNLLALAIVERLDAIAKKECTAANRTFTEEASDDICEFAFCSGAPIEQEEPEWLNDEIERLIDRLVEYIADA